MKLKDASVARLVTDLNSAVQALNDIVSITKCKAKMSDKLNGIASRALETLGELTSK